MRRIILYIACSLDGYIARPDGNIDWLINFPNPTQEDHGYQALLDSVDTIIMGGATYRDILAMDVEWPYEGKQTYVLSRQPANPAQYSVHFISDNVVEQVAQLKKEARADIWLVGGGQVITMLLNAGLVDEMQISYLPYILGEGIALFPNKPKESHWNIKAHTLYKSGIIKLDYERVE